MYSYIDDIICFQTVKNDCEIDFSNYPPNLVLIANLDTPSSANFLDVNININESNGLIIDLYDKRNSFNFEINRIQHYSSVLHNSVFRNIIKNQVYRIKRLCTKSCIKKHFNDLKCIAVKNDYPIPMINSFI